MKHDNEKRRGHTAPAEVSDYFQCKSHDDLTQIPTPRLCGRPTPFESRDYEGSQIFGQQRKLPGSFVVGRFACRFDGLCAV